MPEELELMFPALEALRVTRRDNGVYDLHSRSAPVFNTQISFQNGPIPEVGVNGVTHESLLAVMIDRLRQFQAGPFACRENALALTHLEEAAMWLAWRTAQRVFRGVEGTLRP